ncbi:MAG: hypothetical protein ACLTPN_02570 [Clostridia bacterium]
MLDKYSYEDAWKDLIYIISSINDLTNTIQIEKLLETMYNIEEKVS